MRRAPRYSRSLPCVPVGRIRRLPRGGCAPHLRPSNREPGGAARRSRRAGASPAKHPRSGALVCSHRHPRAVWTDRDRTPSLRDRSWSAPLEGARDRPPPHRHPGARRERIRHRPVVQRLPADYIQQVSVVILTLSCAKPAGISDAALNSTRPRSVVFPLYSRTCRFFAAN